LRRRVGSERIIAVLEPRSNTMKLGIMKDELPASLGEADRIYVYTSGLGWDAHAVFAPLGERARCVDDLESLTRELAENARANDHVLVMSNGGFGGLHARLLARLAGAAGR
jgi:UDP-N-acetylmuramate: L-alanyl-gamma-D-glutamyl-meso-diaminopimelate ligase